LADAQHSAREIERVRCGEEWRDIPGETIGSRLAAGGS
jgi:hypothetical protein